MSVEPKLESYLASLDRALGQISVSDRADIITEIKSHVMAAKENGQSLDSILAALGEPETVANRFLMERGLQMGKPPKSPIVKWLVVGFLGTFGIVMLSVVLLVWRFSPVISVDEKGDRVSILGGMIKVDGDSGEVHIGSKKFSEKTFGRFDGFKAVDPKKTVRILFSNAKIEILPSEDGNLRWDCKYSSFTGTPTVTEDRGNVSLNIDQSEGSKCDIRVPKVQKTLVKGGNGKIELVRVQSPIDVEVSNGKIEVVPDKGRKYRYDTQVTNGVVDHLESSQDADAIPIRITLANGRVDKD